MKDESEKVENMLLNNFSNKDMKKLIEDIINHKDKNKLKENVLNGTIIQKYKKQSGVDLSEGEEEIIKTIYLYLCIEGNAEKIKNKMEQRITINTTPYAMGSEKIAFLQWKDKKQKPKFFS